MSDVMRVQPFENLLASMLAELEENQSIFGIHRSLFYIPEADSSYATDQLFDRHLATPIGPGAGPHTQLAQNIVSAWLSGARFIELKTVQMMDELDIPRPCIDMADEGYNVEWSQELRLDQSAWEYVKAWVLIHVLRRALGFEDVVFGTIFNMSVGYDLAGIQSKPMTRFMDRMRDASEEIAQIQELLQERFPRFADVEIPSQLTDNVTLSTMHGCPPDEIERIGQYLMEERGLHTFVKLNPTLLGQETVMNILHRRLGFTDIHIPEAVFAHDLQYERAVALIRSLKRVAAEQGLTFGVKLSNTLAMANHRDVLPGDEMYMSGRALYPLTMNLFHQLARDFAGDLNVSYSAGADALNVAQILSTGALPVTAVSDILKPGGYSRFLQYLDALRGEMRRRGVASLAELARDGLANLERAAREALDAPRYKQAYHPYALPKMESTLALFDCIDAPCVHQCAVCQDVPAYAWLIAQGEYDRALDVILARNPLPNVTGYVCTHLCQTRCTRNNYDQPVAIRALKRFAAERGAVELSSQRGRGRVAVIGSGPAGLSAAYFLALNGVDVTVYEAKDRIGGMLAIAPTFRLPESVVQADVERILGLGVEIVLSHPINRPPETLLDEDEGFDAVYVGTGVQRDARLSIQGEAGEGVYHALDFLARVRRGERVFASRETDVLVIGGGNSAMDAARTARRLVDGDVIVLYRRTLAEMPADAEEIADALAEGVRLEELVSPTCVELQEGRADIGRASVAALACVRNELGVPGEDGRRRPVPVADSDFHFQAGADRRLNVITAIGQRPDVAFLDGSTVTLRSNQTIAADPETRRAGEGPVYAGGDAVRGPATIIEACADGRKAAEAICRKLGVNFSRPDVRLPALSPEDVIRLKRTRAWKTPQHEGERLPVEQRDSFDLVEHTLTEVDARAEAARCLQCASFCDKCVEVCPNRANYTVLVEPVEWEVPVLVCQDGELVVSGQAPFRVTQRRQIIHVDDFCNACGNCTTFCVHQGQPYLDKPRLFLSWEDFEREEDNAFAVERADGGWTLWRRKGGATSRLDVATGSGDGAARYEEAHLVAELSQSFEIESLELKEPFEGAVSLRSAAEMTVVLAGVRWSLPFLVG